MLSSLLVVGHQIGSAEVLGTGHDHPISATAELPDFVAGVVTSVAPAAIGIRDVKKRAATVQLASRAVVSRGTTGPLTDLSTFEPGDFVAAQGEITGDVMRADVLGTLFEYAGLTILRIDSASWEVETDDGPFQVGALRGRPGRLDRTELRPGLKIEALHWTDPSETKPEIVLGVTAH